MTNDLKYDLTIANQNATKNTTKNATKNATRATLRHEIITLSFFKACTREMRDEDGFLLKSKREKDINR